mmetsp:Transcript_10431/g.14748  ORF Transcript_10431/g.14748 Transcript_10431/m.14748 type:complete len:263 (+) Transcript_10431:41-829(+)
MAKSKICSDSSLLNMLTNRKRQVCLFGVSADPPTGDGGHVGIVKALSEYEYNTNRKTKFDEIRVLPVYQHMFSEKRDRLVSYDHRFKMCQLAFQGIPKVVVSNAEQKCFERKVKDLSIEQIKNLRVGTADLLDMLLEEESTTDFTFCLGADTFMDLTKWKWRRSKDVLSMLEGRFLVISRISDNGGDLVGGETLQQQVQKVNMENDGDARILRIPTLAAVSSSLARSCTDETSLRRYVHPSVVEYIKENNMYGFSKIAEPKD